MDIRIQPLITKPVHQHAEAFCLMWYRCSCGHMERFWNSRDGVTPFCTVCPSCGKPELHHVLFSSDTYAPNHKPAAGQRCWVSMTMGRAHTRTQARIELFKRHQRIGPGDNLEAISEALFQSIYQNGAAPDLVVTGYQEAS